MQEQTHLLTDAELANSFQEDNYTLQTRAQVVSDQFCKQFMQESPEPEEHESAEGLQEVTFSVVHEHCDAASLKLTELRDALQQQLRAFRGPTLDPLTEDLSTQLRLVEQLHGAFLRHQERRRRQATLSEPRSTSVPSARPEAVYLDFALGTLLDLAKLIGADRSEVHQLVLQNAVATLTRLPPLSLVHEQSSILEKLTAFLMSDTDSSSMVALTSLGLTQGRISHLLRVATQLLPAKFDRIPSQLQQLLTQLTSIKDCVADTVKMTWNATRVGPDIAISNEGLTAFVPATTGWSCQLSEQSVKAGTHYYELVIESNTSTRLLLGVAGLEWTELGSKSTGAGCYAVQVDGSTYINGKAHNSIFKLGQGDTLGILIDMDEKSLVFYRNGQRQNSASFPIVSDELFLLACFGGASQAINISNDVTPPDEAAALTFMPQFEEENKEEEKKEEAEEETKEGKEVPVFVSDPRTVLQLPRFQEVNTPVEAAVVLLSSLSKLSDAFFAGFGVSHVPYSTLVRRKLPRTRPLCLEPSVEVFASLLDILSFLLKNIQSENWGVVDFQASVLAAIPTLKLLCNHFFTVASLNLTESCLTPELRAGLRALLTQLLDVEPACFGSENTTKEDLDGLEALRAEAVLAYVHGNEVLLSTEERLKHVNEILELRLANTTVSKSLAKAHTLVLVQESLPLNCMQLLPSSQPEVSTLFLNLLRLCREASTHATVYEHLLQSLQYALSAKYAQEQSEWHNLFVEYSGNLLATAHELLESSAETSQESLVGSVLRTQLLLLCKTRLTYSDVASLLPAIRRLEENLNPLEKSILPHMETWETAHPYELKSTEKIVFAIPRAYKYTVQFLDKCDLGTATLKLYQEDQVVHVWEKNQFPREPVQIHAPSFSLQYSSDQESVAVWGLVVKIEAQLEREWFHSLLDTLQFLKATLCAQLIKERATHQPSLFANSLLCEGVTATSALFAQSYARLNPGLLSLAQLHFRSSLNDYSLSSALGLNSFKLQKTHKLLALLENNLPDCETDITQATSWDALKQKFPNSPTQIGGDSLDQAEEAIFRIYAAFFGFHAVELSQLEASELLAFFHKQANEVRVWSQRKKQEGFDQGQEADYASLNQKAVDLAAICLQLPLDSIRKYFNLPQLQLADFKATSTIFSKPEFQNAVKKVSQELHSLFDQEWGPNDFVDWLVRQQEKALARVVGLNTLLELSESQPDLAVSYFSEAFRLETGSKHHYLAGLDGVDPILVSAVESSFFAVYQQLTRMTSFCNYRETDLLNKLNALKQLRVIEALGFPFSEADTSRILQVNVTELMQKLLLWTKGQCIPEQVQYALDKTKCITELALIPDDEIEEPGREYLSLQQSEVDGWQQPDDGLTQKIKILRGGSLLPIVDVYIGTEAQEKFERVPGCLDPVQEELGLYIERGEPNQHSKILVGLEFISDQPLQLKPVFAAYSDCLRVQHTPEQADLRARRKLILRRAAWVLLKLLVYSLGTTSPKADAFVHSLIAEVFMTEVSHAVSPTKQEESSCLHLKKLSTGHLWLSQVIHKVQPELSPVARWIQEFHDEFGQTPEVQVFREFLADYIHYIDPQLKGIVSFEELPEACKEITSTFPVWSDENELDFFRLVRHAYDQLQDKPAFQNTRLFTQLPKSCRDTKTGVEEALEQVESSSIWQRLLGTEDSQVFPQEFLDERDAPSIALALHSVAQNPCKFPEYFSDIRPFQRVLGENLLEVQKHTADLKTQQYTASLLWVLFQTSVSSTMLQALSKDDYVLSFLKYALLSPSNAATVAAFRLLTRIVASQISPTSFAQLWETFPHKTLADMIDSRSSLVWTDAFFSVVSLKYTIYFRDSDQVSEARANFCSREALEFLRELCLREDWRSVIVTRAIQCIQEYTQNAGCIETCLGALTLLAGSAEHFIDSAAQEWCYVSLAGASLPEGYVLSVQPKKNLLSVFSSEANGVYAEPCSTAVAVIPLRNPPLFTEYDSKRLLSDLIALLHCLEEASPEASTVYILQQINSLSRKLETLVYRVLKNVLTHVEQLEPSVAQELAELALTRTNHQSHTQTVLAKCKFREIHNQLHTRLLHPPDSQNTGYIPLPKELSPEEEERILSSMGEADEILAAVLLSLGYKFSQIHLAMSAGIRTVEGVVSWLGERERQTHDTLAHDGSCLYTLEEGKEVFSLSFDSTGTADLSDDLCGQLVIYARLPLDEKKRVTRRIPPEVYKKLAQPVADITVCVTLGFVGPSSTGIVGVNIGNFELLLNTTGRSARVYIEGEPMFIAPKRTDYTFVLYVSFNGHIQVVHETNGNQQSADVVNRSVYDGASIGDFSLFATDCKAVALKGFTIYSGRVAAPESKWSEVLWESLKPSITDRQFVPVIPLYPNFLATQFQCLGLAPQPAYAIAEEHMKIEPGLSTTLQTSPVWKPVLGAPIVEVVLTDSLEALDSEFQPIPVYVEGERIDLTIPQRKLICIKKHESAGFPPNVVTDLTVGPSGKEPHILNVGSLNAKQRSEAELPISIRRVAEAQLHGKRPLTDIILLATKDPDTLIVPLGYTVVEHSYSSVNIAPASFEFFVFIACTDYAFMGNIPLTPLVNLPYKPSQYGLSDLSGINLAHAKLEEANSAEEDLGLLTHESLPQLYQRLKHGEYSEQSAAAKEVCVQLIQQYPETILNLVPNKPETSSLLLTVLKEQKEEVPKKLFASSAFCQEVAEAISKEVLMQLVHSCTVFHSPNAVIVESYHPCTAESDAVKTLSFPGAHALQIQFTAPPSPTPEPVRLFKQPGQRGLLAEYYGEQSLCLEVQGDSVYLEYDCTRPSWGYKLTVAPVTDRRFNVECAFWALDQLLKTRSQVFSPHMVFALFVYSHTLLDQQLQEVALRLLHTILNQDFEPYSYLVQYLSREAEVMYYLQKNNLSMSSVFQTLLNLVIGLSSKWIEEPWFNKLFDTAAMMRGFSTRGDDLLPLLFTQFQRLYNLSAAKTRESSHPYRKRTEVREIFVKAANFLEIEFDELCELDPDDSLLLTYDEEGLHPIEETQQASLQRSCWANDPKGPDIVLSNNNRSVTRTRSTGWGCAVWSETISKATVKLTFHIDNDGRSDYLFLGIIRADENYRLNEMFASESAYELWTWKTSGEFHSRGQKVNVNQGRYRTGDFISLLINLRDRTMTCAKNGKDCHVFTGIAEEVIPVICIGGNNQHVTLTEIETVSGKTNQLSRKRLVVRGPRAFLHFPVNVGYANRHVQWKHCPQQFLKFSPDKRRVTSLEGLEDSIIVASSVSMVTGMYFIECTVSQNVHNERLQIGLLPETNEFEGSFESLSPAFYDSTGLIYTKNRGQSAVPLQVGDVLGLCVDFVQKSIAFYLNCQELATVQFALDYRQAHLFGVCLHAVGQEVTITPDPVVPEGIDLKSKAQTTSIASAWGYKFQVTPIYSAANKMGILDTLTPRQLAKWEEYRSRYTSAVTVQFEEVLTQRIDDFCHIQQKNPLTLHFEDLQSDELRHYSALSALEPDTLKEVFYCLQEFNRGLKTVIPFLSVSQDSVAGGLNAVLTAARGLVFYETKNMFFNTTLNLSASSGVCHITVDRTKALKARSEGKVDSQGLLSVFHQVYRATNSMSPTQFRHAKRLFKVGFQGEGSVDDGGPYSEVMSTLSEELMGNFLTLFVPSRSFYFVLNPTATSAYHLDQFLFLGKLFGSAIRTRNHLSLLLPPLFWKRLLQLPVDLEDLRIVDDSCVEMIDILNDSSVHGLTEENFREHFPNLVFTALDSAGRSVELIHRGRETPVEFGTAKEYAELVKDMRLQEAQDQFNALRSGMKAVVPFDLLGLFTWMQVEQMVCGAADLDVDLLMSKTEYQNIHKDALHVKYFWDFLRESSVKDRALFLRFVSGRSRLPVGTDFGTFKIARLNKPGNPNVYLPVAHTCFFQLELPQYTSYEILKERFLYAITHCQVIDLDRVAQGGWE